MQTIVFCRLRLSLDTKTTPGCTMGRRNGHFEWVSFCLIRDRAYQRQTGVRVV